MAVREKEIIQRNFNGVFSHVQNLSIMNGILNVIGMHSIKETIRSEAKAHSRNIGLYFSFISSYSLLHIVENLEVLFSSNIFL